MTDRKIVLLRHAKAERPDGGPDIERELIARGRADAMAAGAWLAQAGLRPDEVICSPASRTRQTWLAVAELLGVTVDPVTGNAASSAPGPAVRYEPPVYGGSPARLLKLLQAADPAANTLLLVGHNPTISDLSVLLAGDDRAPGGDGDYAYGLRTAGLVVHEFDGSWPNLSFGAAPARHQHTARG
nr:histidine phosphatase family protein [Micromonospora sp. DSM 115978]